MSIITSSVMRLPIECTTTAVSDVLLFDELTSKGEAFNNLSTISNRRVHFLLFTYEYVVIPLYRFAFQGLVLPVFLEQR